MLSVEQQVSILAHLSRADQNVADEERELIRNIGERNGLTVEDVDGIIESPVTIPNLRSLPADEKFTYLYDVIQLMKVDGKIFQSEIKFCERLATQLGYRQGVVSDLSVYIYSDPAVTTDYTFLRNIADRNLLT